MKLEMTLPERPGFLHAVPILDLFALMLMFFLLAPSLIIQSGVAVDLPLSRFQMDRYQETLVVTIGPGQPEPRLHLGRDPVTPAELAARLDGMRDQGMTGKALVLVQADASTAVAAERSITEMILAKGFRVALVGRNPPPLPIPAASK